MFRYEVNNMIKRSAGILMHITSLPSPYGIGTIGKAAYDFVDFLKAARMHYWQILPLCPPSEGNSPYSAYSSFAGNPLFIDLDLLIEDGLLKEDEVKPIKWYKKEDKLDYNIVNKERKNIFKLVCSRFDRGDDKYRNFIEDNKSWLLNYAKFMTLSDIHKAKPWYKWKDELKNPDSVKVLKVVEDNYDIYEYHLILQYLFYQQWSQLLNYAHENGIKIIGDLPIYAGLNSSDVYGNQELFKLGDDYMPIEVAGCPPDAYALDGQKWGNPLYDWQYHKKTDYAWWIERIRHNLTLVDVLRIDHFRGFDAYFAIPYDKSAKDGHWQKGPGMDFFDKLKNKLEDIDLIAEDLGYYTPSLKSLLKDSGYPGMRVLEFAFDSRDDHKSDYLPHKYIENTVAYTGTHDNNTLIGWINNAYPGDIKYACDYVGAKNKKELPKLLMKSLWMSKAKLVIVQAQDILGLDGKSRMNIPSVPKGNWSWRAKRDSFAYDLAEKLAYEINLYGRDEDE